MRYNEIRDGQSEKSIENTQGAGGKFREGDTISELGKTRGRQTKFRFTLRKKEYTMVRDGIQWRGGVQ